MSEQSLELPNAVWPVGQVSASLGVSALTLRSWERRYGIGPSLRTTGRHRRYSQADVNRLRRMQAMIQQGMSPRDAARLSQLGQDHQDGGSLQLTAVLREAEALHVAALDRLLDGSLARFGMSPTWSDLVVPAFRNLEQRYVRLGDCTDIELVLAQAIEGAIERYLSSRDLRTDGRAPVLLVACPQERHTMPLAALQAVLLERSQPVVVLGPDADDSAVVIAADRVAPRVVVLWSVRRQPGQARLRSQLSARGHLVHTAGPGWPRSTRTLSDLDQAADTLTDRRS
ncbi:MerR family transcriptional regulator [Kribbella sp. NPDC056861]|uniref:MerR family transcriptional regulator n=1 Tax=Kribbella sp. NPDC056861 TaxID=3154857 RepID=UPI003428E33E